MIAGSGGWGGGGWGVGEGGHAGDDGNIPFLAFLARFPSPSPRPSQGVKQRNAQMLYTCLRI